MKKLDDLLGLWPAHADMARDIGINPKHVSVMVQRQKIPVGYWSAIIVAAQQRAKSARAAGDKDLAARFDHVSADTLLRLQDALDRARA
jgi:hypothetical protein